MKVGSFAIPKNYQQGMDKLSLIYQKLIGNFFFYELKVFNFPKGILMKNLQERTENKENHKISNQRLETSLLKSSSKFVYPISKKKDKQKFISMAKSNK